MNELSVIINKIEQDIKYGASRMDIYDVDSADWCFHLGRVDASRDLLWQLRKLLEQE